VRSVMDEYRALIRHVFEFCGHAAADFGKSADPVLDRETPHIQNRMKCSKDCYF
jgi:hypothetical protein